jgi:ABC-type proline/glycine betaine transport system ATPase subunit
MNDPCCAINFVKADIELEAPAMSDRIAVMLGGRIMRIRPPSPHSSTCGPSASDFNQHL